MALQKIKTVGIDQQTGLSRLAVTPKKKSKMKKIIPAVIAGAAIASAVGAFGGTTAAAGGGSFLKGLKSLFGFGGKSAVGTIATSAMDSAVKTPASWLPTSSSSGSSSIFSKFFEGITKVGGGIYDKFKSMSATDILLAGQGLSALSVFLDDEEDFSQENFEAELKYKYDALEAQKEVAMAELAAKNRANALAGTYMGFTSPVVANADGVTTEKGYTPPKMPSAPTGGGGFLS